MMLPTIYPVPGKFGTFKASDCHQENISSDGWDIKIYIVHSGDNEFRFSFNYELRRSEFEGGCCLPSINSESFSDYGSAYYSAIQAVKNCVFCYQYRIDRYKDLLNKLNSFNQPGLFQQNLFEEAV